MKGYVYVLVNEAMPGLVKIGRSISAAAGRAKAIYRGDTGVPLPFDIHFECLFSDCIEGEALVHEKLRDCRVNPNREFFKIDPEDAAIEVMRARAAESDHVVEYCEMVLNDSTVPLLAHKLGRHPFEIVRVLDSLGPGDLKQALADHDARLAALKHQLKIVDGAA